MRTGIELTHANYRCSRCCCPGIHAISEDHTKLAVIGDMMTDADIAKSEDLAEMIEPGEAAVRISLELVAATVAGNEPIFKLMCHTVGPRMSQPIKVRELPNGFVAVIGKAERTGVPANVLAKIGEGESLIRISRKRLAYNMAVNPAFLHMVLSMYGCDCDTCDHMDMMVAARLQFTPDTQNTARALEPA